MPVQAIRPVLESTGRRGPSVPGNILAQQPLAPALSPQSPARPVQKLRCARYQPHDEPAVSVLCHKCLCDNTQQGLFGRFDPITPGQILVSTPTALQMLLNFD